MDTQSYLALFGFIAANTLVACSGAVFRPGQWYEDLSKPSWRPPNWLFGPVWMVLYGMIAFSGWLVWRQEGFGGASVALTIYAVQLILNALWSAIFFGMRRLGLAFFEMVGLWLAILANIVVFYPLNSGAALLLVPYLLWVSFAMLLNFAMWRRNPQPA